MTGEITRKLTTILAADAANFSGAMNADEVGTYGELSAARTVFSKLISRHGGRIANTAGDGLIAEFPSVVEAMHCAVEAQQELHTLEAGLRFRIGLHLGDVIVDGDDLIGEGVNLAARLQSMAEPGGVLISQQVYDQVHAKLSVGFEYLGEKKPRNLPGGIPVYRVALQKPDGLFASWVKRQQPEPGSAGTDLWRYAKAAGLAGAALIAVNLATGWPFWAHWPALGAATLWGVAKADSLVPEPVAAILSPRATVLLASLILVNLFSWTGYAWSLWPVGAALVLSLGRRILSNR